MESETFECTFSPKINSSTNLMKSEEDPDVGTRLFKYQEKYRSNLENKKENLKEYHSYKPKISRNTDKIIQERENMLSEMKKKYEMIEKNPQETNRAEKTTVLDHMDEIEETNKENESLYHRTNSQDKLNSNNASDINTGKKIKESRQSSIHNMDNNIE